MSNAKRDPGEDRRRARRTVIQESFQLFLVIPQALGMARISLRDLSAVGLSFRTEIALSLRKDQLVSARIYLNPAFYLPIEGKVVRAQSSDFGLEFLQPESPAVQTLVVLQSFFEAAEKAAVFVE